SHLPVDKLIQVRSVECTACMECVSACPAENALQFSLTPQKASNGTIPAPATHHTIAARWKNRALKPWTVAAALAIIFFGLVGTARITGHWQTNLSREIYMELVPNTNSFDH